MVLHKHPQTQLSTPAGDRIRDDRLASQHVQAGLLIARQGATPALLTLLASIEAQLARGAR